MTRPGFLTALGGSSPVAAVGPNWYAAVMGTGIVAVAAATLPVSWPALTVFARLVWLLAGTLLVIITAATVAHWVRHPALARRNLTHPVMANFYGAPAMALMTVGAGTLLLGQPLLGHQPAMIISATLWTAGTALGLVTAVAVPYQAFTRRQTATDAAFGGWLMPVVPPMVSAATGPLLIPYLPTTGARQTMLYGCYALFGLTLVASLIMITMLWSRLVHHELGAPATVPTLWIVLGPLGQSITASHTLGAQAIHLLPAAYGQVFTAVGVLYGVAMWGFALLWVALAAAITIRTAHRHLPFALTWWSFTFPVGTLVTGTSGLAAATGLGVFVVAAVICYLGLLGAWAIVFLRTLLGAWSGRLLRA